MPPASRPAGGDPRVRHGAGAPALRAAPFWRGAADPGGTVADPVPDPARSRRPRARLRPGRAEVTMPPELVLIGILPPLLYVGGVLHRAPRAAPEPAPDLPARGRARGMTTAGVAVVAHRVADLPWAEAFILGAVVSPTDPIAATAIGSGSGCRRLLDVIEGESLLNDGTALVLLRTAIVAAVAGTFSPWPPGCDSSSRSSGESRSASSSVRRPPRPAPLDNPPLEVTIAFLTGYFAFLPASVIGVSGVLAVVTVGVYIGWHTPELTTVETRLQGRGFWEVLTFLFNVLLFGLVGLQLRPILDELSGERWPILVEASAIVLAVVVLRIVWVFAAIYLPRWLIPRVRERDPAPPWTHAAFVPGTGMRGAATIAAALLIPLNTDAGTPLPGRELIIFFAFAVVLATLVVQGLSLPVVIRALRLEADDGDAEEKRPSPASAPPRPPSARLDELEAEHWIPPTPPSAPAASTASGSAASLPAPTPTPTAISRRGHSSTSGSAANCSTPNATPSWNCATPAR